MAKMVDSPPVVAPFVWSATLLCTALAAAGFALRASAQELAEYFGFTGLEVVKIERAAGPIALGDLNDDGLLDLIAVNNFKSRLDIHYQKEHASPEDALSAPADPGARVNDLPEHWRYRRQTIAVSHRIGAILAHDYDADGMTDLIYAGTPSEIVFLRQADRGMFEVDRRHRVRGLEPNKDSLILSDVLGDEALELLTIAEGEVAVYSMNGSSIKREIALAAGAPLVAIWSDDFDGNGRADILGAIPEDGAPLRLWLGEDEHGRGAIGAQVRFEMPGLVEAEPIRLPGSNAAHIAVIERASRRIIVYGVELETVQQSGDRDASMSIFSFTDAGNRQRDVAVFDVDGDDLLDLVATDTEANSVVIYKQAPGKGLTRGDSHPSLADLLGISVADVDQDGQGELFVLSEEENVIGRSELGGGSVNYPVPVTIPDGKTPVAMNVVSLEGRPTIVAVVKDGRRFDAAMIGLDGATETVTLGSLSRAPDSIVALDADQDGHSDILLLTRDKPMMMLRAEAKDDSSDLDYELLESKDMGQFGLVQAASAGNTAVFDIDGDGKDELLIADRNFVRAVRYEPDPPAGISPGWQVVRQINAQSPDARLVSIAIFPDRIIAADQQNSRLVVFAPSDEGDWRERERVYIEGFAFNEIFGGSFSGDGEANVLAVGDDGFAIIRLAGDRIALNETNSWRTNSERRLQHELTSGDVNGDGFLDLISLDVGEQMLEIFTFSETGHMMYATGFQTFESRIFSGGDPREYEPSECLIGDVTGDGANDIVLLAHDRMLIYPQMTRENRDEPDEAPE